MLRNRKNIETDELNGVNLAADEADLQLGWFTSLSNWIPGLVSSLRKKRGVGSVGESSPGFVFAVISECGGGFPTPTDNFLLLETGEPNSLLLETGDHLLLE